MKKHKILIIEDELAHLNVMESKLKQEGYDVLAATDGEKGLQMIRDEKPDLILLDVILPKMDGFTVLEHMTSQGISIPVIIVSNSGQPVDVDRGLKLGAKDYVIKTEFGPDELLLKIKKVLEEKKPPMELAKGGEHKMTILVVEDDKFLRDLIKQKLQREGFQTIEAIDGEEGIKKAKETTPHLILLDIILPGIDGFEVLSRLKASSETSSIPVIVLSNLGQKEDVDRALAGGAEDFMTKAHLTPGEIISKIKAIAQKKYF